MPWPPPLRATPHTRPGAHTRPTAPRRRTRPTATSPPCPHHLRRRTRSQYNSAAESTLVSDIRLPRVLTGAAATDEGQERADAEAEIQRCTQVGGMVAMQGWGWCRGRRIRHGRGADAEAEIKPCTQVGEALHAGWWGGIGSMCLCVGIADRQSSVGVCRCWRHMLPPTLAYHLTAAKQKAATPL